MVRFLLLGMFLLTSTAGAQAQDLDSARAAFQAGRFGDAFEAFETVLEQGGQPPSGLVQVHLHLGIIRALRGERDEARRHFEVALAVDPDLEAPPELNPDLREQIERVRREREGHAATIHASPVGSIEHGRDLDLRLAPAHAPPDLVQGYVLQPQTGSLGRPLALESASGVVRVPAAVWGPEGKLALRVEALDSHVNTAFVENLEWGAEREPAPLGATEAPIDPPPERGVIASPWLWTGVGVVVAGAAVAAGLLLASPDRRYEVGAPTGP